MANDNEIRCDYCGEMFTPKRRRAGKNFCKPAHRVSAHKAEQRRERREQRIRDARSAMALTFDGRTGGHLRAGFGGQQRVKKTLIPDRETHFRTVSPKDVAEKTANRPWRRSNRCEVIRSYGSDLAHLPQTIPPEARDGQHGPWGFAHHGFADNGGVDDTKWQINADSFAAKRREIPREVRTR
jgi:hypothetical protein